MIIIQEASLGQDAEGSERQGPRAFESFNLTSFLNTGVLVECDPSIRAIIVKIDQENNNEFIVHDLDEQTLLVREAQLPLLKQKLEEVKLEGNNDGSASADSC